MSDIVKKTLLLVEDETYTAEIISKILHKNNFDVIFAANGEEAIRVVNRGQVINLILMDIVLGSGTDGIEAARIILQNHDIPIIFLSGYSDMEILQKAEEIASYGYVLKHSGYPILIASIKMALNLYEARQKVRKQENELHENAWFKNLVFETISDGVITIDENGTVLFANKMIETIFGYRSSDLIGRNLTMLMPEYLRDNHSNSLAEYIKTGRRHLPSWSAVHVPGLHKEGFEISLEMSFGENTFQGQRVFCGIVKDITEHRQAEEALKEREKAFRAMFADNPVPMLVYEPETLKILEVNDMAINHYGYSRDEFLKMTIADMRPAEDIPKMMKKVSEVGRGISRTGVWRHLKRDGTVIHVEITSHSIDYLGKNARLVLAHDVTERVDAEEKLQQQYSMLQGIIESTDALIFSIDNNGLYTSFNKSYAAMTKLVNGEEIEIGKNVLDYIRDETEHEIIKQNNARVLRGESFSTEHSINTYPPMIFEVFHNPIRSVSGDVVGAAIFSRDITERKQAESNLKESETFFRLMFENNPIPMWIYDSDTLRFLEVNDAALKHYGYSRDEFLSIIATDIRSDENIRNFMRFISKLPEGSNQSDIRRHRRKDGTIIYVEILSDKMDFLGKNARLVLANDVTERIISQHKLAESQQRLTLALKAANAGVWEWKLDDKEMFWTEECYRVMGLNPKTAEPSYRNWLNSIYSEDREHARFILSQAFETCNRFDVEYRIVLPDGKLRWIRNIGYAENDSFDSTCNSQRMIGLQIDITDQKQAEEHLSDQYSILRSVMESMDAAIFSSDAEFRYTSFNMNHACIMKAIYGADIEVGRNILDYMTSEEDRNKARQHIGRALRGERFTVEEYSGDELGFRRYFELSYNPIRTSPGKILGVVVFARDITESRQTEIAIRESEKKYRRIVDTAHEGIIMVDENFKITFVNIRMAAMIGYSAEEMIGKHFEEFLFEKDRLSQQEEFVRRKQGHIGFYERELRHKDGSALWTIVSATPITDDKNRFIASIGMFTDITTRKKAEDIVKQQNDFLNNVINALNHPFYVIDVNTYKIRIANKASMIPAGAEITCHELTHQSELPCESPDHPCAVREIRKTKQPMIIEHVHYDSDGNRRYVDVHVHPIFNENGDVIQVIEYIIDITERKNKDEQLRISLEKYKVLFESFPLGITITDPLGKLLECNRKSEELLGVSAEEHARRPANGEEWHIIRPDGTPMPTDEYASIRALREQRGVENVEMGIVRKDGSITWISVNAAPIPLEDYGVAVAYSDIGARKQAEFALQNLSNELEHLVAERTAEVQDLYNNAPCGYHSLDADGLIVRINDTELNWLGYTREEILGKKTFDQIICNPKIFIENFPEFKQRGSVKDLEFKMIRKDGSVFPALLSATAITDSEGKYLMSRSTLFDITEFKKIEQKLRESEERFRVAIKNSPLMVFMQDKDLRYIWVYNQHPAFSSEEIIGKTDDDLLPESAAVMNRIKRMVLKTGQGIRQEISVNIKGMHFFHDLTVEPLIDASEQIVGVVSASMNITTHKLLEEKLRQRSEELGIANAALEKAARLKDEFLASMSHELRTPLTGVISLSEALLEEVYGDLNEKQRKTIRTIESSGQHLLDLITDILDLSKIEAGQMELQIEKSSVSDICQSALQLTKGMADKKHHKVSFRMNPASASVDADPRRLKQILVNLLSNAVKFTPEHGEIGLEVRGNDAEQTISFSIRDTGIGIAPEMFPMLFKPFVQLDSRLSRQYSGTGLGLSLVQRMAELHGGSVSLESEVGKGSCFTISLPWRISAPPQIEDSDDMIIIGQEMNEERHSEILILLVEDNEINIGLYSDYLQSRGYDIRIARNGAEGVQKAREIVPALILMDIQMPGTDGLEAIRHIRADMNPRIASVPIIALTSLAMPGDREKCLASGANDYLSKPVPLKHLSETIGKYLVRDEEYL